MALESCKVLCMEHHRVAAFFVARGNQRGVRDDLDVTLINMDASGIAREDIDGEEIRLMPIKLLTFNETETEE